MTTLYRIRDWEKHFENNRTREIKKMDWVPVKNKHDGEGYLTIMAEPDGIVIYGCWHLILQVASKCDPRGTLLRDSRTPHTARSIALKAGWRREKDVQRALDFCSRAEVGWIEALTDNPAGACDNPAGACVEGKGREGKGTHTQAVERVTIPDCLSTLPGWETEWSALQEHRRKAKASMTDRAAQLVLNDLAKRPHQAIAAMQYWLKRGWRGFDWKWYDKEMACAGQTGSSQPGFRPSTEIRR